MIHNHWGRWIDTEEPVTCVYGGNELNWEYLPELIAPEELPDDEYGENTNWLLGDWTQNEDDGLWDIDHDGSHGFAMLYDSNDNIAQLVWSRDTGRGAMCSPCYPGQVDSATVEYDAALDAQLTKQEETLAQVQRRVLGVFAEQMNPWSIDNMPFQKCYVLPKELLYHV